MTPEELADDRRKLTELVDRYELTQAAAEVVLLMARGFSNQEIANIRRISVYTVNAHIGFALMRLSSPDATSASRLVEDL